MESNYEFGVRQGRQPDGRIWYWRYYNSNGYATAIVAVITPDIDWAAYIGGGPTYHERDCVHEVARHGAKLGEAHARFLFPDVKLPYRR